MAESSDIIKLKKQMKTASNQLLVIFGASGDPDGAEALALALRIARSGLIAGTFLHLGGGPYGIYG